jgi:hypothetical protein
MQNKFLRTNITEQIWSMLCKEVFKMVKLSLTAFFGHKCDRKTGRTFVLGVEYAQLSSDVGERPQVVDMSRRYFASATTDASCWCTIFAVGLLLAHASGSSRFIPALSRLSINNAVFAHCGRTFKRLPEFYLLKRKYSTICSESSTLHYRVAIGDQTRSVSTPFLLPNKITRKKKLSFRKIGDYRSVQTRISTDKR